MTPQQTITTTVAGAEGVEPAPERRWVGLLTPSLSDLFFVALIVWLFLAGAHGWQSLLADGDVGWHIRTGEYILDHHRVPHQDLYSFSKPGAPWYAWEWLTDVFDALLFRWAGLKGVVLAAGVVIAWFATTLMRRIVNAGAHLFAALMVTLLSVGSASMHFLARPHVFTLLLLSISMGIIEADRRGGNPARIWWLVPITLVWTNLHGGFLVLIAVLGLAAAGSAAEAWLGRTEKAGRERTDTWRGGPRETDADLGESLRSAPDWSQALRYGKLAVACAAVSFVNPYGWGLHVHVIQYLQSDWIRKVVQEFQSPSFRNENMLQFEVLLFIGLMAGGARFRRAQVTEGLWVLAFAYLALSGVRHVPVFVTVTAPLLAAEMTAWWQAWAGGASKKSAAGILNQMGADLVPGFRRSSVWGAVVVVGLALTGEPIAWPKDFPDVTFPTALVHAHEQQILHSRVLTTDQWADYLIFLHPEQKVFVDGRSDFYGPEIGNQFLGLMNGDENWQKVMERYKFNVALVPADSAVAQLLRQSEQWRLVDQDKERVLLALKSNPVFSEGIVAKN